MDILSAKGINQTILTPTELALKWETRSVAIQGQSSPSTTSTAQIEKIIQSRGAGILNQTFYCVLRSFIQQIRTLNSFILEVFVGTIAGVLLVCLYLNRA